MAMNATKDYTKNILILGILLYIAKILPVINSLLNQTMQANKIILWLSHDKYLFDAGVEYKNIPPKIRKLAESEENKFEIRYTENTGPFRKLLPALEHFNTSEDIIVTADDDIIYPDFWLESLYKAFLKSNCVVSFRAKIILSNNNNHFKPYVDWPVLDYWDHCKDLFLCPTGNNGILYSPEFFDDRIFDPVFKKLCTSRCDIWFSALMISSQIQTEQVVPKSVGVSEKQIMHSRFPDLESTFFFRSFLKFDWPTLWALNVNLNDKMIDDVFRYHRVFNK
jgi:hypothetical protein